MSFGMGYIQKEIRYTDDGKPYVETVWYDDDGDEE